MAFVIGLVIGSAATFMVMCIICSKKIEEAYDEGFNHGRDYVLHRLERGVKDDRDQMR